MTMKRIAAALVLVMFAAAACEEKAPDEAAARDALPGAEYVKINLPEGASKPDGLAKLGELSPAYVVTLGTALTLNGSAAWVLILARVIVAFPVTSVEGDTLVWGPWHGDGEPGEYKLTARLSDEGVWEWALSGRRSGEAGASFQTIVAGEATPGRPRRGSGAFTVDLDVARAIDPESDGEGQLSVEYDLERNPVTLVMDAEVQAPMPTGGTALMTFHYDYEENADRSGELGFAIYGDTDDPGSGWEMSDFRSRWRADGAGRADVQVTGGDMGSASATATECWDDHFLRTYYTDSVAWIPTEGSASSCVF
jgi:hypothetical protein